MGQYYTSKTCETLDWNK